MFQDTDHIKEKLHKLGLASFEAQILALAETSVDIVREAIGDDTAIPVGASKLGGHPDLPAHFAWPYWGEKPLTFIAQFNLSDITQVLLPNDETFLPKHGMLSFFYEADDVPMGTYQDRGGWQVVHITDSPSLLQRRQHPTAEGQWGAIDALPPHQVRYQRGLTLPMFARNEQYKYGLELTAVSEETYKKYWKLVHSDTDRPHHFLLGHPWLIQGSVIFEAVYLSHQIKFPISDEARAELNAEIERWQFLFQIDSDQSLGVMWGDVGVLYVCIPKISLQQGQFENSWTVMQCY